MAIELSAASMALPERAFFGESMFSTERDASKIALVHLVARLIRGGFTLLDTQFVTEHLAPVRHRRGRSRRVSAIAGGRRLRRRGVFRSQGGRLVAAAPDPLCGGGPAERPSGLRLSRAGQHPRRSGAFALLPEGVRPRRFAAREPNVEHRMLDGVKARALGEHPAGEDPLHLARQLRLRPPRQRSGVFLRRLGRGTHNADTRRHLVRAERYGLIDRNFEMGDEFIVLSSAANAAIGLLTTSAYARSTARPEASVKATINREIAPARQPA